MVCQKCQVRMEFRATLQKNDQYYHFFQCPQCGKPTHTITYKYSPATCPNHQFEFIGTEFQDSFHNHQINQVFRCDRCGAIYKRPRTVTEAGMTGAIEIEHPRVQPTLLLNQSVAKRIDKELGKVVTRKHPIIPSESDV